MKKKKKSLIKSYCDANIDLEKAILYSKNDCERFPNFPDCEIITHLSAEKYERNICKSNMAFIPKQYEEEIIKELQIEFKYPVPFDLQKVRTIRKMLESVDSNHCLVFCSKENLENLNFAIGITRIDSLKKAIPIIKITGHMEWEAYIGEFPLFRYKCGSVQDIPDASYDENKLKEEFISIFPNNQVALKNLKKIVKYISKLGHGTSLVLLDSDGYRTEVERLLSKNAGHGIELKQEYDFSKFNPTKKGELTEFLDQVTKIDGGLIMSLDGKMPAIGCIFDGEVYKNFEGNVGRGSRYNSVKLYVNSQNHGEKKCLGIVFSDDGTVDFIGKN